jgi:hypothetical protein
VEEMMAIIQRNRIALEQEEAERRRSLEQNSDSATQASWEDMLK